MYVYIDYKFPYLFPFNFYGTFYCFLVFFTGGSTNSLDLSLRSLFFILVTLNFEFLTLIYRDRYVDFRYSYYPIFVFFLNIVIKDVKLIVYLI